jgi:capsule biosynthesis phosphatase
VEKIKLYVLPVLKDWLERNQVPYHQIEVGKPWGPDVYYVDDRGIQPQDFVNLTL